MIRLNFKTLSTSLILIIIVLSVLNWQKFPFFLDIYYHLNVMRGFDAAGGVTARSFWELAPNGNIHLYPPLFHILLLIPYKLGIPLLFIARFSSIAAFTALLAVLSFVVSRLFSNKLGFFVTMAACIPYTFFLKSTITIPATLALTFILLAFYAIETGAVTAASLLIAASLYTHIGLPWIAIFSFLMYGALRKEMVPRILQSLSLAIIFSLPVISHLLSNLDRFENILGIKVGENELFEIYPLVYLFAIIGLLKRREGSARRGRDLFFIALFIGLLLMLINYQFRFVSAEGLLPIIFFAGAGLERCYDALRGLFGRRNTKGVLAAFYLISAFIIINLFSPTISLYTKPIPPYTEKELLFYTTDSTITNLLPRYKKHLRPLEINLYNKESEEWLRIIEKNTADDDIICSNCTYIGGMLSAFSGRVSSTRFFYEIKTPPYPLYEIGSAKLLVWIKEPTGGFSTDLQRAIEKYKFEGIAQTANALVLTKPDLLKRQITKPLIKTGAVLFILFCAFFMILYDLARARKKLSNLSKSSLE